MTDYNHEKDLEFFIANQTELVEKYDGKILLIHNAQVDGNYESVLEASKKGDKSFGEGNFSIQKCIAGEEAYTIWIG